MMLQGCRKADRAEVVERDCFATPNSLKSQGERNYFPRLVILVPKRQSCACLRGQYTLRKITRHSNQVPRLNLRRARGTAGAPLPAISWRFSDAGRRSAWIASSCRHPKTLYGAYWCQGESVGAVESFCHVTRLHLRHGQPLARLRRAVKPQSRLRRGDGAGLDGAGAVRAIIIVAATTYKVIRRCSRHCGLLLWGPLLS